MADDLGALGEVITDRTLVLNVIRGLNDNFAHVGALLQHRRPFPSFLEAHYDLILEEITMENRQPSSAAALAASTRTATASSPASFGSGGADTGAGSGSGGANTSSKGNNSRGNKCGDNGRGNGGGPGAVGSG